LNQTTKTHSLISANTKRAIILLIFGQLAACVALQPNTTNPDVVLDPASANIESILQETEALSNASQSTKAAQLIKSSMLYHPENLQLSAALTTYQKLSDQEMSWLESDALVKHALWLRSELRKENVAVIAKPSYWKKFRISRLEVKQNHAHKKLIRCAEKNIEHKPALSRRCLDATNKDRLTDQQLEQTLALRHQLKQSEVAKIINEQIILEATPSVSNSSPPQIPQEIEALKQALFKKDYLLAKQLSNSLKRTEIKKNREAQRLINLAEKKIQAYQSRLAQRASALYLQEKVAEADALWLLLIKLNPENNKYRQNHERAQKILKNIKTIKEENKRRKSPASLEVITPNQG